MLAFTIDQIVAGAVVLVPLVVWLLRLEGRVNTQDMRVSRIEDDVRYIRERIDRALESRNG